ncbi:MAG: threonine/serine dehydratase [Saprospiraceae bacterium]|nr:threonine/serine dehydratase [Saprospiraceae bacterium]
MTLSIKQELLNARWRIDTIVHRTPVLTSSTLDAIVGAEVFLKCENFQRMGAYKMRGASHAIAQLHEEQLAKGVVTHSSGNFAQAIALAAKIKGVKACIVMPENAPAVKVEAVKGYGAEIVFSGSRPIDREQSVKKVIDERGMTFIHPSNDLQVILGNSTCTQEFVEEIPGLDIIIAPVGGGGLLAGTALAAHWLSPMTQVWAAEPENVDDAYRSLQSGQIEINETSDTIADGLRTNLGDINFPIIKELVTKVLLVSEDEILSAMWWVWERMKIIIEPSSAVAVAAVIRYKDQMKGKRIGVIISGGNADIRKLAVSS